MFHHSINNIKKKDHSDTDYMYRLSIHNFRIIILESEFSKNEYSSSKFVQILFINENDLSHGGSSRRAKKNGNDPKRIENVHYCIIGVFTLFY